MSFNVKSLALAIGVLCGGCIFFVGLAQQIWPGYGVAFLELAASLYPGYEVGGFGSVILGTLYGVLDGAVAGAIVGWLYNLLAGGGQEPVQPSE